jgi:hypothetical protein
MSLKNNVPCNNPDCEHKWYYEMEKVFKELQNALKVIIEFYW